MSEKVGKKRRQSRGGTSVKAKFIEFLKCMG
jgi:hypothetical protein